jgi:hypothetical protein
LLAVTAAALLTVPRRWASLPLVAGACYLGFGQGFEFGSLSFTTMRILVAFGFLRVVIRKEQLLGGFIGLDGLMILWAAWACASSAFHEDPKTDLITKLGNVYNACGLYFLIRVFCTSFEDAIRVCRTTALVLIPVALGMLSEQFLMSNPFTVLGSAPETPMLRDGRIRAFGPFNHPILAGTAGAVSLPLMMALWNHRRVMACLGTAACLAMVITSGSSGPVLSAIVSVAALCMWPYRQWLPVLRWSAVVAYILLDIVMKAPAYYLIARLDVTGSSTGYHRAMLIDASIAHFSEWWFAGTDYTRHWMPTGVSWSSNHTDITNHYLQMGVIGGVPLMLLFIAQIVKSFSYIGTQTKNARTRSPKNHFVLWALGSALLAHAATCISVSYFDQSVIFFYLTLAVIASACQCSNTLSAKQNLYYKRSNPAIIRQIDFAS